MVVGAAAAGGAFALPGRDGATLALRLRPFGTRPEHLAVDFADPCEPRLVTEILARCLVAPDGGAPSREALWDLEVGRRIEALLRLAALDAGSGDALEVELRCAACRSFLAFELPLSELAGATEAPAPVRHEGRDYRLRRPTARDQLAWLRQAFADEREAAVGMAASLLEAPEEAPLDAALLASLEEELERADPLVRFSVALDCPDCGRHQERALDLSALALRRLSRAQDGLIDQVHRLAAHYHWSEAEILALPAWRRARYLALIEDQQAGRRR